MSRLVSSKHLESVSDLTLSAPVKQGFIDAFEAVTYETRLRKVLEALFKIWVVSSEANRRVGARSQFHRSVSENSLFERAGN